MEQVASAFHGARRDLVARHLEIPALMGEVVEAEGRIDSLTPRHSAT